MSTSPDTPEQLVFDLPHRPAMDAEDFLVSACNEAAVRLIDVWPDWPHNALLLIGTSGAGKTHLANVWRMKAGAYTCSAKELTIDAVERLKTEQAVIIEDIDRTLDDETALFHLLNFSKEHQFSVLMTAQTRPGTWQVDLPDLRSRLRAAPIIEIEPPDSVLLDTILVKLFNDRQMSVPPHVIRYISLRMERSVYYAQALVEAIDKTALATGRKITRQLVAEVMDN